MAFGDTDLTTFFADFGVPCIFGGVSVNCLVDAYDQNDSMSLSDVNVADRITDVTARYNAWSPFPKRGQSITVNAVAMKVREVVQEKDGALTHIYAVLP